jgi:hypothetical protein
MGAVGLAVAEQAGRAGLAGRPEKMAARGQLPCSLAERMRPAFRLKNAQIHAHAQQEEQEQHAEPLGTPEAVAALHALGRGAQSAPAGCPAVSAHEQAVLLQEVHHRHTHSCATTQAARCNCRLMHSRGPRAVGRAPGPPLVRSRLPPVWPTRVPPCWSGHPSAV